MEGPQLDLDKSRGAAAAPLDDAAAAATGEASVAQKVAVAAGVAGIGAYIGCTLLRSRQATVPQALWSTADELGAADPAATRPRVALVNMSDNLRACATAGLGAWLDVEEEVALQFPTVMVVEEAEAAAIADLAAEVRRATLFAWAEVLGRRESGTPASAGPLCCVVYRTIAEVDGQALNDWDVRAAAARQWHGRRFAVRHCLGCSVDGKHVMTLMHDVDGVLRVPPETAHAGVCVRDSAALLHQYGTPSQTSFRGWRLSAESPSSAAVSTATVASAKPLAGCADGGVRPSSLWLSPVHVFAALGAVLRYHRTDAPVYPHHIATPTPLPLRTERDRPSLGWCASLFTRQCATEESGARAVRQRRLSSRFVVVVRLAERSEAATADAVGVVEEHVAVWLRDVSGAACAVGPTSTAPRLAAVHRSEAAAAVTADMTDVVCSVVAAEWLLLRLVCLLASLGMEPALAELVAVPESPDTESMLYPTSSAPERRRHLWQPRAALAAAGEPAQSAPPSSSSLLAAADKKLSDGVVISVHVFSAALRR
ncbi:hypothetical protein NESM_000673600 [Novymonas esmeraldas]|uniref:Uncharacterized protein n=1 Tax=Novymonas esmeraldas TaxID=1808958 RepID=A0AAW0EUV1_9TRYP